MLHKYSWEGAQRGNPAAMAILANFYGKGLASRFLKMDPKLECILAYKWMAQWEYLSYPETGKVAPKDSNLETIEIPLIGGRNFFPDHNANNRLLFAINRFGRLIFFPNMYFAVGVSKERRIKDFSLYHIRAMNWKDPKNPIPISDSEIKAAMSKVDEFVPNQLLAECGDKNAQMALAMSLHSAGEYPVSYKWMLLAEKGGHKLAKIRLEKFDWESAHKKEGKKLAQNFSAKKNPYPYSW